MTENYHEPSNLVTLVVFLVIFRRWSWLHRSVAAKLKATVNSGFDTKLSSGDAAVNWLMAEAPLSIYNSQPRTTWPRQVNFQTQHMFQLTKFSCSPPAQVCQRIWRSVPPQSPTWTPPPSRSSTGVARPTTCLNGLVQGGNLQETMVFTVPTNCITSVSCKFSFQPSLGLSKSMYLLIFQ